MYGRAMHVVLADANGAPGIQSQRRYAYIERGHMDGSEREDLT